MYFDSIYCDEKDKRKLLEHYLNSYYSGQLTECSIMCDLPKEKHMLWKDYCRNPKNKIDEKNINQIKERIWLQYKNTIDNIE